jgi:hypothetical protein
MSEKPLQEELEYYNKIKDNLLQNHPGKFALIKRTNFVGAFDSAENAYAEGVALFGTESFLIKQITQSESSEQLPAFSLGLTNANIP